MSKRSQLLAAVGAGALLATPVQAEEWFATVQGGFAWAGGEDQVWAESEGATDEFYGHEVEPAPGATWRIGAGRRFGPGWDAGLFIGGFQSGDADESVDGLLYNVLYPDTTFYTSGEVTLNERLLYADLEIGHDVGLGGPVDLRILGGLRVADLRWDADTTLRSSTLWAPWALPWPRSAARISWALGRASVWRAKSSSVAGSI